MAAKQKSRNKKNQQTDDSDGNQMNDVDKQVNCMKKSSNDNECSAYDQQQKLLETCMFDPEEGSFVLPVEIIQHLMNTDNPNYSWEQLVVDIQSGNLNFNNSLEKVFDDDGECVDLPDDFIDNDDNDDEKLKLEETLHQSDKISGTINGHHPNQTVQIDSMVNIDEQTLKQSKIQRRHQRNHRRLLRKFERKISRLLTEKGDWKNESVWLTLRNRVRDDFIELIRKSANGFNANTSTITTTTTSSVATNDDPIVTSSIQPSLSSSRLPEIRTESNNDGNRHQSMNGSSVGGGNQNPLIMTIRGDDRPIDLIDDNSDDLFNDSYMDIDTDPGNGGNIGGGLYSPMMMSHMNCSQPRSLLASHWDDGILMGPDSGCIGGGGGNIPTSQRQQLMAKLIHQDFFNKFDDLLDNDDLQ